MYAFLAEVTQYVILGMENAPAALPPSRHRPVPITGKNHINTLYMYLDPAFPS